MYLPLFFKAEGLACLVVGGGEVAARKLVMLVKRGCALTVIAPQLAPSLQDIVNRRLARWTARKYEKGDCSGYQLVVAATEDREVNRAVFEEARALGIPVNVVDDPELCTVIFSAVWDDGPLTVAVSTGGTAPFMAAAVRDRLAAGAAGFGRWVDAAVRFREAVRLAHVGPAEKNRLYREFLDRTSPESIAGAPDSTDLSAWLSWLRRL